EGGHCFALYARDPPTIRQSNGFGIVLPIPVVADAGAGDGGDGGSATPTERQYVASLFDDALTKLATDRAQGCSAFNAALQNSGQRLYYKGFPLGFQLQSLWVRPPTPDYPRTVDCANPNSTMTVGELDT